MSTNLGPHYCESSIDAATELRQREVAENLSAATGGKVKVEFAYGAHYRDDIDADGHLFSASVADDPNGGNETDIMLDDRQPDLRGQLIAELRRVGEYYFSLADQLKASAS